MSSIFELASHMAFHRNKSSNASLQMLLSSSKIVNIGIFPWFLLLFSILKMNFIISVAPSN